MTDSHIGLSVSTSNGKSAMAALARPPDNPPPGDEWKKIPDVRDWYEFSHRGLVRSLDHTTNGTFHKGKEPLTLRPDPDGYLVVNITMADGTRKNGASVARLVLLAHDPEGYAPGLQACHGPGGQQDNRWPENLRWDTDEANRADWRRDNPPKPKPLKTCPRCGAQHGGRGQNCHECVVKLGIDGARLRAAGVGLQDAADQLGYPPVALDNLMIKYGDLHMHVGACPRLVVVEEELNAAAREIRHAQSQQPPRPWLRRVLFRREASRQNSDAR